jgi:hypothetical protein
MLRIFLRGLLGSGYLNGFEGLWGGRFARSANAHLSDDETVAKMGRPYLDVGHPPFLKEHANFQLVDRYARRNLVGYGLTRLSRRTGDRKGRSYWGWIICIRGTIRAATAADRQTQTYNRE